LQLLHAAKEAICLEKQWAAEMKVKAEVLRLTAVSELGIHTSRVVHTQIVGEVSVEISQAGVVAEQLNHVVAEYVTAAAAAQPVLLEFGIKENLWEDIQLKHQ
jgi:hypothetical protein